MCKIALVNDSATDATLRSRKMRQTAASLTAVTRRLTAERGLGGFTVEEVCDEVDISRRTFFNYFSSKEDAIIGAPDDELRHFTEQFLAREPAGWGRVLDDLVELAIEHFESTGLDSAEHGELMAALEREPKLLLRFMGLTRERDKQAVAMVAQREGVAGDDPHAEAAIAVLSMLLHSAGERYLRPDNEHQFSFLIHDRLAALRAVLVTASPRKGPTT
jgi:AcrR family transcriptional regulator